MIEVHFEADQFSQEMSVRGRNEVPEMPRAGFPRKATSQASQSLYNEEPEEVDYKGMMLLDQMQERPNNADLQDYYRKKGSKDNKRRAGSKIDRST